METGFQGVAHALALHHLLLHAGEDDDVGVYRHADAQDDTRDARQGQRHVKCIQDHQHDARVDEEGKAGRKTREQVHKAHEHEHEGKADCAPPARWL